MVDFQGIALQNWNGKPADQAFEHVPIAEAQNDIPRHAEQAVPFNVALDVKAHGLAETT
jgi:hypothetical protein